jgi:cellulose synthase/poly-beta-1,6-N-acetylglucosamine synthase-like glycosyltransferase
VLILANNEAEVIDASVLSVRQALDPQDAVYVIADNCQDATAERAAGAGAFVLERRTGAADGKGTALKWFIGEIGDQLENFDLVALLDADNRIAPEFLREVKAGFQSGAVMQCFVQPVNYHGSSLSMLIALSEIHEQKTVDRIRSCFGWPVRLRGTGMVMPPALLKDVAGTIDTQVEDIALSLLFVSRGVRIVRNDRLCVYDPKPQGSVLASRQRARWFRGQWVAFWRYRREVIALLMRGPQGWSLLGSLFLKPRWLVDLVLLLLGLASSRLSWFLAAPFLACVLFDGACLGWTILSSEDRVNFLKAILHVPTFIFMWLRSLFLAYRKMPWLRARP